MPEQDPQPTPARPGSAGGGAVTDPSELTSRAVDALRIELSKLFDTRLDCLEELTTERFRGFTDKLADAERLRLEQKADTSKAVDAALAAAKEAVGKTETTFGTALAAQDSRYDDLKERLTRIESSKAAANSTLMAVASFIFLVIAIIGFIAANGTP